MAYGTINGKTKEWSDKEIKSAKGGGQFFTPASTPTQQTTATPKATTTVSAPKVTSSPIISTPKASEPENLWGKNPITSTPIQADQVAGISGGGSSKKKTTTQPVLPVQAVQYDADPQLAAFQKQFVDAEARGDIQGKINAMEGADNVRISKGLPALNTDKINQAKEERKTKISNQIKVYGDAYQKAYANKDIQGMLDAAQQADDYRASIGEARVNDALIKDLKSKLQGGQSVGGSIASQMPEFTMPEFNIPDYESKYTNVMDTLNKELINDILNPETSPYRGQIEELIKQLNDAQFSYDAGSDANLQNAIENTSRQVMEQLNRRGILNSTITQQDVSTAIANLTGQYSNLAYQRFQDTQSRQFKILDQIQQLDQAWTTDRNNRTQQVRELASYINTLDNKDYSIYKDTVDQYYKQVTTQIEIRKQKIELQRQKIKDAWERVQNLGYADNEAALILGILPGTLSKDVQAEARKQQYELDQMKAELDKQLSLKQADYEVSTKLQQQRDAAENARLQYTQEQQNARTKYQEEQQNNRTYASIQASKDKASSSKTNVNSAQNDYYQSAIADIDAHINEEGNDPESAYKRLVSNNGYYKDKMGPDNYNKAVKHTQDLYYDLIVDKWRGEYGNLKKELQRIPDYYKNVLGSVNFNKAMNLKEEVSTN